MASLAERTIIALSLEGFLDRCSHANNCVRCSKEQIEEGKWACLGQVKGSEDTVRAVGGALCEGCVYSFQAWIREGPIRDGRIPPQ